MPWHTGVHIGSGRMRTEPTSRVYGDRPSPELAPDPAEKKRWPRRCNEFLVENHSGASAGNPSLSRRPAADGNDHVRRLLVIDEFQQFFIANGPA